MNTNHGMARRAVVLMFGGTLFVALLAMLSTTVMDAESQEASNKANVADSAGAPANSKNGTSPTANSGATSKAGTAASGAATQAKSTKQDGGLVLEDELLASDGDKKKSSPNTKSNTATKNDGKTGGKSGGSASGKEKEKETPSSLNFQTKKALDGVGGELSKVLRKKGSLTLKNTTLKEALFLVGEQWRINIVVGSDVDGNVDATFDQTPLFEILENILTINGFGYRISGQTLTVASLANIPEMNPLFETALIELKAARPSEVFEIVKKRLSVRGEIKELASSNSLLVNDFPERIEAIRELAMKWDESVAARKAATEKATQDKNNQNTAQAAPVTQPNVPVAPVTPVTDPTKPTQKPEDMKVLNLTLKNVKVMQVMQAVDSLRSRDGKITPLANENKLVIVDYQEKLDAIEKFLKEMEASTSVPERRQFDLKYKKIAAIMESVRGLMSADGKMTPFDSENKLMVVDHKANLAEIEKLIKEVDTADSAVTVAQFSLKHIKVTSLTETLQTMISRDGKYTVVELENSLVVIDYPNVIERVRDLIQKMDREERGVKTAQFTLSFVRPSTLEPSLRGMLTKDGRITVNDVANQITIEDYPYVISKIENLLKQSDVDGTQPQLARFRPQFMDAALLKDTITNLLSQDGKVTTIDGENQVLVFDYPYNIERVRKAIQEMDVIRPQVRISVLIYDMSIDDALNLGLNFQAAGKARYNGGTTPGSTFKIDSIQSAVPTISSGAASTTPAGVITLLNLSNTMDLGAVINALSTTKNSRLLADPSLTVVDRKKGSISVVKKIPIQQLTQTGASGTGGGAIGTTTFQDAGIKMEVTPRISEDHTIEMQVKPEFSRLAGFTPGPPAQPIIESRLAETTVWVNDRQTFVIGGLRQRNEVREDRGFPGLKDVKKFYINRLFGYEENQFFESELVVFIHPEIVTPCYPGREREVPIGEFGWQKLDEVPQPNHGACQVEFENGDPSKVKVYEDQKQEPLPAPSAKRSPYGKQAANPPGDTKPLPEKTKPSEKVAADNRFSGGYGETWGRKPDERGYIPTVQQSLRNETSPPKGPSRLPSVGPSVTSSSRPSNSPAQVSVAPTAPRNSSANSLSPYGNTNVVPFSGGSLRATPVSQALPPSETASAVPSNPANPEETSSRRRVLRPSTEKAANVPVPPPSSQTTPNSISQQPIQETSGPRTVAASEPERMRYAMSPIKAHVLSATPTPKADESAAAEAARTAAMRRDLPTSIRLR